MIPVNPHKEDNPIEEEKSVVTPVRDLEAERWNYFIEAVIWQESRGVTNAIGDNGQAVGVLQIHPIMVREANRILALQGINRAYTYEDRYDREKSIEMFNIVQNFYNKEHDFELALRIWNRYHPESYKTRIFEKYNELTSI